MARGAAPVRARDQGFTLVELLVALAVFALLASAGVGLLRASVDAQARGTQAIARSSTMDRFAALLASDAGQALIATEAEGGGVRLDGAVLSFLTLEPASANGFANRVRRIGYRFADGRIERLRWAQGTGNASAAPLVNGVAGLDIRVRNPTGAWLTRWPERSGSPLSPTALEMVITPQGGAPVIVRALLGGDPVQPPVEPRP